ncbi:MAG: hypothetical protein ACREN8_13660 [Candidatus Dormibacteraceae bacterium]
MNSRITLNVRSDLLQTANSLLEGVPLEDTVDQALEGFITYRQLVFLSELELDELTPQALTQSRAMRFQASE